MAKYIPVIGMEVHCEMKTASKMFSPEPNGLGLEETPNVHIDLVTTAQPGTLPVPNEAAIKSVQRAGLAMGCEILRETKFDRKNYFYPDLPKGYQISQYDQPLCGKGALTVGERTIGITRIHMEEDTGKSRHPKGADYTLVDLNRAGVPLMELVTEPDITSGAEARAFCQELQRIIRYLDISDADMEKGQMRCEVNISLHKEGEEKLSGTKVEIKNLNSFRAVERAVDYEIARQTELLEAGEAVVQETRGWDDAKGATFSQRAKESAHDYRYFPEPDIPPMTFDDAYIAALRRTLPELPAAKRARFREEFGLRDEALDVLIAERTLADYYEAVASELQEKQASKEIACADTQRLFTLAANYIVSELTAYLVRDQKTIADVRITPENFAELIGLIADGKLNSSAAQKVLTLMYEGDDDDPSHIMDAQGLAQMDDDDALAAVVDAVLAANAQSVADYKAGKDNALKYLMGQVMKETKGKANPQKATTLLKERLTR